MCRLYDCIHNLFQPYIFRMIHYMIHDHFFITLLLPLILCLLCPAGPPHRRDTDDERHDRDDERRLEELVRQRIKRSARHDRRPKQVQSNRNHMTGRLARHRRECGHVVNTRDCNVERERVVGGERHDGVVRRHVLLGGGGGARGGAARVQKALGDAVKLAIPQADCTKEKGVSRRK